MRTTNKTRVYSATSRPASTTNGQNPTMRAARPAIASRGRRFGMSVGECIIIALAFSAAARLAGGER